MKTNISTRTTPRPLERVHSFVNRALGVTISEAILHLATQTETLIRIIIDGAFFVDKPATVGLYTWAWALAKNPNSAKVYTVSLVENLDDTRGIEYIASGGSGTQVAAADASGTVAAPISPLYRDIKAQRKLKKGDDISFDLITDNASDVIFIGTIDLWFKQ